jgi:hypothetical protein
MPEARILLGGVLAVAGYIILTLAIVAIAPYLALALILGVAFFYWLAQGDPEKPPDQETQTPLVKPPGD